MVQWVNRALIQAPRNGTTTHTVTFPPASAGNLLVCVVEGSVTSSTPSGWTLPAGGSAVNYTGLYVWWKVASAGESSLTTTHNGANYPVAFVVYEFPAGSTFGSSVPGIDLAMNAANPNLTGLTGTNLLVGVMALTAFATNSAGSVTWSGTPTLTEDVDRLVSKSGTDGYLFSIGYAEGATVASWQPTGVVAGAVGLGPPKEALTFAVKVAAGGTSFSGSATLTGSGALGSSGVPVLSSVAGLSGAGSLASSGTPRFAGSMSSTAVGSLTATGSPKMGGQASLSGAGALAATGAPKLGSTVILAGTGSLSTVGTPRLSGTASMTGSGTLSTEATGVSGQAVLSGTGILVASGVPRFAAAVSLASEGILTSVGTMRVTGAAHFTGYGTLAGGPAIPQANITVTATLDPRTKTGALIDRSKTGTLTPNRWAGTL